VAQKLGKGILVIASVLDLPYELLIISRLSNQDFWLLFSAVMVLVISGSALLFAQHYKLRVFRREWRELHLSEG
jgi:hypothetical protein